MKGAGKRFDYIKGNIFEIPFFQRPYVWEEKNWKQLIESIDEEPGNNFPYLGKIKFNIMVLNTLSQRNGLKRIEISL